MSTAPNVAIVAFGASTAVGTAALSTAAAVRAGVANLVELPWASDRAGNAVVAAAAPCIDSSLRGTERLLALALPAAFEALAPILEAPRRLPITLLVALPEPRPGLSANFENEVGQKLVSALRCSFPITGFKTAATGHAGGLLALKHGCELVASGMTQLCLVGGVDSWIELETLQWLDAADRLHSERTHWGFCPGEAAGFCLLCPMDRAQDMQLTAQARILSVASAMEPNRIQTETVCIAKGLTAACRDVLGSLPSGIQVNHTVCDLNGEPYRGDEYGFMMARLGGHFREEAEFETPARSWGDVGAASGTLFAMVAAVAAQKRYSRGPLTLLFAGSDSGLRSAALLQTPEVDR